MKQFERVNERWYLFGGAARVYRPMEHLNLPAQFASMPLETFFATYGPLGWMYAHRVDQNKSWKERTAREKHALYDELGIVAMGAEPVDWAEAHRAGVAWCLRAGLALALPRENRRQVNDSDQACDEVRSAVPRMIGCGNVISFSFPIGPKFGPHERLSKTLALVVGSNLGGVRRWVEYRGERLTTNWGATALVDMIYSLLADALTGERLRVCEHCAKPFVQTDLRQRFCPPTTDGAKSRCMNTALVRRKRAAAALRAKADPLLQTKKRK